MTKSLLRVQGGALILCACVCGFLLIGLSESQAQDDRLPASALEFTESEEDTREDDRQVPTHQFATIGDEPIEYSDEEPLYQPAEPGDVWTPEPAELIETAPARSPSNSGGMMGMGGGGGGDKSPIRFKTIWQPAQAVSGQPTDFGVTQYDLNLMAPLWMSDPYMVFLTGGIRADLIQTEAVFPQSGRAFPRELYNVRAGINTMRRFENGWTGGVMLNVGSGSDQPFAEFRDVNFGVIAFLRVPHRERHAWNFSLFYSPLSQIPYPLPMVSYQWQPSDQFNMNIGLPLQMTYRPTERLTFDASYMLLTTVHTQASYQALENWRVYTSFDWQNQSWFLHDRDNDRERLFLYDKRLSVGVQTTALKHLSVDLSTGYAFDRYYFLGENFDDRNNNLIEIGDGLFVSGQAGWKW